MYAPVRQNTFCKAADILADKCGCDVIARFEIDGDAVEVDNLIKLQKRYSDECYVSEYRKRPIRGCIEISGCCM